MNKNKLLKHIAIITSVFICFFVGMNNNKVKAETKNNYKCRYNLTPFGADSNHCANNKCDKYVSERFLFSLEYNGSLSVNIYDLDTKQNANMDAVFADQYQFFLDKKTTKSNLQSWDFNSEKQCPSLWIQWVDGPAPRYYYGQDIDGTTGIIFSLSEPKVVTGIPDSTSMVMCTSEEGRWRNGGAAAEPPCHTIELNVDNTSYDNDDTKIESTNTNVCLYYSSLGSNDAIEFSINSGLVSAKYTENNIDSTLSTSEVNVKQLNGKCPDVLYTAYTDGFKLYTNRPITNSSITPYYLVKTSKVESVVDAENSNNGCETLGSVSKYVKLVINLVRYLVPTIIISLSTIDFVGVAISGESDKMEKAKKRFVVRLLVGIIILFVPFLLELLLKLSGVMESNKSINDLICVSLF